MRRAHTGGRAAVAGCAAVAAMVAGESRAQSPGSIDALKKLSVEELMNVEIYSASRRLEPVQGAAAAIFVLTQDDIRRSRVTTVPDALRLVPGVQVGRVDANKYAVSIRGFNSREANKLLVLVDGRSVYDALFSGMLWESQDLMLEDVDRIEVIRGPGGTLWGANAVNGVINIITRHSRDSQGTLLSALVGTEEKYTVAARHGWQLAGEQYARVYAKAYERDEGYSAALDPYDRSKAARGGFRWDWSNEGRDEVRVSGDVFQATTGIREDALVVQDVEHSGHNVIARWNHKLSGEDSLRVRFYYDRVDYDSSSFDQSRDTYDLELQHTLQAGERHQLVWGGGYRRMSDLTVTSDAFTGFIDVLPRERDDDMSNIFIQDSITLVPEELRLIVGLKYESTDYADSEWLPNLRLSWTPTDKQTWWVATSEAARVPSRIEADLTFFAALLPPGITPGDTLKSEHVRAYELGYRHLATPSLWYDVALFYNGYTGLRTTEGLQTGNLMYGAASGGELAVRWQPRSQWQLDAAYTYLSMDLGLRTGSLNSPGQPDFIEGLAPRHQFSLRSALDLPRDLSLDATLRFVDELAGLDYPSYTQLDLALSWLPRPHVELALVGRNLFDSSQPEHTFAFSASGVPTEVQRGVYLKLGWSL